MSNSIVLKSALNAAAGFTLLIVGFACSILVARILGPEANGAIAFALWLALTGSLVAELGTGVTLLRMLPQLKVLGFDQARRRGFAARLLWAVIGSTVLFLLAYLGVVALGEKEHWLTGAPLIVAITAALFFVQSIGTFTKNYLIGEQQMVTYFRMTIGAGLLQLVGVVAGASLFGYWGALAGYICGHLLPFGYALSLLSSRPDACGTSTRGLIGASMLLSVQFVVDSVFLSRLEFFFLQHYHSLAVVGYYAAAVSLSNLAVQIPIQLSGSLLPYYSEQLQRQGGDELPPGVFEGVARSLSYVTLPVSLGLAAIAPRLVELVLGTAYQPSGTILATLALGTPIYVLSVIYTQYLFSHGKIRERLVIGIIGAVLMVAGAWALVPGYGGEGAALVRLVVFLVMSLLMMRLARGGIRLDLLAGQIARVTLAAGTCAAIAWGMLAVVAGVVGLVLAVAAGGIAYVLALRIFRAIPDDDRLVLERIAARLPGRAAGAVNGLVAFVAAPPSARDIQSEA